ncbi:Chromate resistance protein ChrB [Streptomyces sp. NPDC008092]|uniref:Chromate resistance protein ChrB n=1 Tax=Streptomyces sp. NPDC008092 TaxID=3364808 RepID=UPI0036EC29BE
MPDVPPYGTRSEPRGTGALPHAQRVRAAPDVPVLTEGAGGAMAPTDRHRHRHRDLTARYVFGPPLAAETGERLRRSAAACVDYAERALAVLHGTAGAER